MTNTIILDNFLPGNLAEQCLNAITDLQSTHPQSFSRYDNPWEHKTILNKKLPSVLAMGGDGINPVFDIREAVIATCLERMRHNCRFLEKALQFSSYEPYVWEVDATYHYDGVFIYGPGDSLAMHLDAGIHPTNGLRKHATAVLFLTTSHATFVLANKEPWPMGQFGDPDMFPVTIDPLANRLVCFVNDDNAWHGVPAEVWPDERRVVLTVSFMSQAVDLYANKRTRAYFADTDDPAIDAMRDERSREGHDLYRVNSPLGAQ